jgi:hypothetical protein
MLHRPVENQLKDYINEETKGTGYSCKAVSWEDSQRYVSTNGVVTCWGPNISDVRLETNKGQSLYMLRSENWNEKVVLVKASALVVNGSVTLESWLKNSKYHGKHVGLRSDLFEEGLDSVVSTRFQAVFLSDKDNFCTSVHNYQTTVADDPKNLLLLCTPQGTSVYQDMPGHQKLFHQTVGLDRIQTHWMMAEKTRFNVGAKQHEGGFLGLRSMGQRMNVQMLVQIPLMQKPVSLVVKPVVVKPVTKPVVYHFMKPVVTTGVTTAAHLSRGQEEMGLMAKLTNSEPSRDKGQPISVTITMYYVVTDGLPLPADIRGAIDDLEELYGHKSTRLQDIADSLCYRTPGPITREQNWVGE